MKTLKSLPFKKRNKNLEELRNYYLNMIENSQKDSLFQFHFNEINIYRIEEFFT